jgi:hypothetical protein
MERRRKVMMRTIRLDFRRPIVKMIKNDWNEVSE